MAAVHQMDLSTLPADKVDILSRILPNEEERKIYAERGGDEALSDEVGICYSRTTHFTRVFPKVTIFIESVTKDDKK